MNFLFVEVGLHGFGHAADVVVLAQQFDVAAFHRGDERPVPAVEELCEVFLSQGDEEFAVVHGVERQEFDFADGEGGLLVQGDA